MMDVKKDSISPIELLKQRAQSRRSIARQHLEDAAQHEEQAKGCQQRAADEIEEAVRYENAAEALAKLNEETSVTVRHATAAEIKEAYLKIVKEPSHADA